MSEHTGRRVSETRGAGPAALARTAPSAVRRGLAALVALIAATAVAEQSWYRGVEAADAAWLVHALMGSAVIVVGGTQTFYFAFHHLAATEYLGIEVSLACSSLLFIVPLAFITAALAVVSQITVSRLASALLLASALVAMINLLRLVLIAELVNAWGVRSGFGWAHTFFGSLLMLAGMTGAAYLYYRIARRPPATGH